MISMVASINAPQEPGTHLILKALREEEKSNTDWKEQRWWVLWVFAWSSPSLL